MIKHLVIGAWVCGVTLGSSYAAMKWQESQAAKATGATSTGPVDLVRTKMISVPFIADGAVQGYVAAQFIFSVDRGLLKSMSTAPEAFLLDAAFKTLYGAAKIDFRDLKKTDLPAISQAILANVNERMGARFVADVFIHELKYVSKAEARNGVRL